MALGSCCTHLLHNIPGCCLEDLCGLFFLLLLLALPGAPLPCRHGWSIDLLFSAWHGGSVVHADGLELPMGTHLDKAASPKGTDSSPPDAGVTNVGVPNGQRRGSRKPGQGAKGSHLRLRPRAGPDAQSQTDSGPEATLYLNLAHRQTGKELSASSQRGAQAWCVGGGWRTDSRWLQLALFPK